MLAVLINTLCVLAGGTIGLLLKKGIPARLSDSVMKGIGLCTLYIGISGSLSGKNTLVLIISIVAGGVIGELCDFDGRLRRFSEACEARVKKRAKNAASALPQPVSASAVSPEAVKPEDGAALAAALETAKNKASEVSLTEGFVTASLLFCVGAMTVVGSLDAGFGDNTLLLTKSTLDFISSIILASSLGAGVLLSSAFVLIFQGTLVLLAGLISPYLGGYTVAEMTCAGSVLIVALGLNLLGLTKIKVMNYLPALFLPILLCLFMKA